MVVNGSNIIPGELYGSDILYSALNLVIFHDDKYAKRLMRLISNEKSVDNIINKLKFSVYDNYRFSWTYTDNVANLINIFNDENPFCAFGKRRNEVYIEYLRECLRRHWRPNMTTLDLGCGEFAPLSIAALMVMNGAAESYAVDLMDDIAPRQTQSAINKLIGFAITDMEKFNFAGLDQSTFILNALKLNTPQCDESEFKTALARQAAVHHRVMGLDQYEELPQFDFVHSVSVIEHLPVLGEAFSVLYGKLNQGGVMCHVVDFSDHGEMSGAAPNPFFHLTKDGAFCGVNGLRLNEVCRAMEQAGFSVEVLDRTDGKPSQDVLANLKPEYEGLPMSDITCLQAVIQATKV